MSTRKALIFVGAALALIAFSIPASASALTLKDAGAEVNDKEFELSGSFGFSSLGGGINCPSTLKQTVNGQTVRDTTMTINTASCTGTGGLAHCKVTADQVTGLPWTVDVDAKDLTTTGVVIDMTLSPVAGQVCSPKNLTLSAATVTAVPDSTTAIHSVTISGEDEVNIEGVVIESEVHGSFSVVGTDSGTYGIG